MVLGTTTALPLGDPAVWQTQTESVQTVRHQCGATLKLSHLGSNQPLVQWTLVAARTLYGRQSRCLITITLSRGG